MNLINFVPSFNNLSALSYTVIYLCAPSTSISFRILVPLQLELLVVDHVGAYSSFSLLIYCIKLTRVLLLLPVAFH